MRTKSGQELDILGQTNIGDIPHFVVKLASPVYVEDKLISIVLMPFTHFEDVRNDAEYVEVVG
jgi:predicted metalloenzyme YecM